MAISTAEFDKKKKKIMLISLFIAIVAIIIGVLVALSIPMPDRDGLTDSQYKDALNKRGLDQRFYAMDFIVVAMMVILLPYGIYVNRFAGRVTSIEERLPDFLRDVAEAGRFGMTLADAIIVASAGRYGPLSEEIKKMAAQIQWGVPATEALGLFAKRVDTPMVNRIVAIIIKASDAGGNVADVLTMVSHDAREHLLTLEERKISMATYLTVIYMAFGVFLFTIYILNSIFLPQMQKAGLGVQEAVAKSGVQIPASMQINLQVIAELAFAFVIAVIAHAIGDGLMAGVLMNGRITSGFFHSAAMLAGGYIFLRLTTNTGG